jgi:hypothetical protein
MGSKIYVGGLPYATTDAQYRRSFGCGTVESARVITDKSHGTLPGLRLRRDGSSEDAQKRFRRSMGPTSTAATTVNEARPQEKRSGGFGDRGGETGWRAVGAVATAGRCNPISNMKGRWVGAPLFVV